LNLTIQHKQAAPDRSIRGRLFTNLLNPQPEVNNRRNNGDLLLAQIKGMKGQQLSIETGESYELLEGFDRMDAINRLRAQGAAIETRGRGGLRVYRHRNGKSILTARRTAPGRILFRRYGGGPTLTVSDVATLLSVRPVAPRT